MKVVVWGTGNRAKQFMDLHGGEFEVAAVTDNDPAKWGQRFYDRPIIAPHQLGQCPHQGVILCSHHHGMIAAQIVRHKLTSARVLVYPQEVDPGLPFAERHWNTLQISVTDSCNLVCAHCHKKKKDPVVVKLPRDKFRELASRFEPAQFDELFISNVGEVTLLDDLPQYVEDAVGLGYTSIGFATNASRPDEHYLEAMLKTQAISKILVSMEATEPGLYARIRGQSLELPLKFLSILQKLREKYGPGPKVIINFTCMRLNLHEVPAMVGLAHEYGVDGVFFVAMIPHHGDKAGKLCMNDYTLDNVDQATRDGYFRQAMDLAGEHGINLILPYELADLCGQAPAQAQAQAPAQAQAEPGPSIKLAHPYRCTQPFSWVKVDPQGQIYPCCQIADAYPVGNVLQKPFAEIWQDQPYQALRDSLVEGGQPPAQCARCNVLKGYNF